VCLHGSAKSVIAAEYLNIAAAKRGLALRATASGLEPDELIPEYVTRGLLAQGIDISGRVPVAATSAGLAPASRLIAFGCELGDARPPSISIEQWSDCPAVSEGFDPAWRYITSRVDRLLEDSP
jgi:protein-tyrosine-phosphatase